MKLYDKEKIINKIKNILTDSMCNVGVITEEDETVIIADTNDSQNWVTVKVIIK